MTETKELLDFNEWNPEGILRSWAKAYRETTECRFPSDPHAEFFPVDLEGAAAEIERLRSALRAQPRTEEVREAIEKAIIAVENDPRTLLPDAEVLALLEQILAAQPTEAPAGEVREKIAAIVGGQHYADFEEDACQCAGCEAERDACREVADRILALAAVAPERGEK